MNIMNSIDAKTESSGLPFRTSIQLDFYSPITTRSLRLEKKSTS